MSARPGHLKQYALHANISRQAAAQQLVRVGINYLQPFDFAEADRRRAAARHADRAPFSKPIYGLEDNEEAAKNPRFAESQARLELFKSKLSELEFSDRVKEFVRADLVEQEADRMWRLARASFAEMVDRISGDIAEESDPSKVKMLLQREFRQAMATVVTSRND